MSPQRIQRRRTKGWRMPESAVYVGRGSKWGNPWKVGEIDPYYAFTTDGEVRIPSPRTAKDAVDSFRDYCLTNDQLRDDMAAELAGKDLACWCPLDQPCHADVLLQLANQAAQP